MEDLCTGQCSCKAKSQGHLAVCSSSVAVPSVATSALSLSLLTIHSNSGCSQKLLKTFFLFSFSVQNLLTSSILKMPVSEDDDSFHKTVAVPRNRQLASPLQVIIL